jgi:hypothetical protein
MSKFSSIEDQQIAYLAGIIVDIDRIFSTVEIYELCEEGKKSIFLQDHLADEFIAQVDKLEQEFSDEPEGHELLAAYPYGDMLTG